MNQNLKKEFQLFKKEVFRYFSPDQLNRLAKETKFVQRSSKFSASECIALCVWLQGKIAASSLNELCNTLAFSTGVIMSPEALNLRFNKYTVAFLQALFSQLLSQKIAHSLSPYTKYHGIFQRIRLLDSTSFQIPDIFSEHFPGTGCTSLKIQLEFDILSGQFLHVHHEPGKTSDFSSGTTCAELVQPGDLCLRDLGYFKGKDFQTIANKEGYYLSRIQSSTQVYVKNPNPSYSKKGKILKKTEFLCVSLEEMMDSLQEGETIEIEKAYIGGKAKFPVRLFLHRLSEEQKNQRLSKLENQERDRGIRYSERGKCLTGLNAYITNLPTCVKKEEIHDLYSLRWQIELLFKTWKSFLKVDVCKAMKLERLQCHIYAQFITLLICTSTVYRMRCLLKTRHEKELSEYKAAYMVLGMFKQLYEAIKGDTKAMERQLSHLFSLLQKNGCKSRRDKKTALQILGVID